MSIMNLHDGSQIACDLHESSATCGPCATIPITLSELLVALNETAPKSLPMLRSTASKLAVYFNMQPEEISLDSVYGLHGRFRQYLVSRKYAENSIRSYVNYLRILIQEARRTGWSPYLSVPEEWRKVLLLAPRRKCTSIARALSLVRKHPKDITVDDVAEWGQAANAEGESSTVVGRKQLLFWRLLKEFGFTTYEPLSVVRSRKYMVSFEHLPEELQRELVLLLNWKTAEFSPDRPKGAQIRQITADGIRRQVCQLYGFATTVRKLTGISSLAGLVLREIVSDYLSWCINERGVQGETLLTHLGRLEVALRQHPRHALLDISWFKPLLESLPSTPLAERRKRKEKKYLDYSALEAVPEKIRVARESGQTSCRVPKAVSAEGEFLIRWLLALPWRQRNIRECRIGGTSPNIFKATVPNGISVDMPQWIRDEAHRNPTALFWQMHFGPKETKTGKEIHAFVPRPLIKPLEEYLEKVRPLLVTERDPGTLFMTKSGMALDEYHVYHLVTRLTEKYGGRRVNPHLFRDIVAFAWLKEHPKDYLTLSKILWHANVNVTLKVYGSRFDESSGVCAMETWLEQRQVGEAAK